jgi:hypothetical protein
METSSAIILPGRPGSPTLAAEDGQGSRSPPEPERIITMTGGMNQARAGTNPTIDPAAARAPPGPVEKTTADQVNAASHPPQITLA